ncbi:MAG TPA: ThuA domain-containing protein [Pirellulaceae bacterium]|nr:ThuA domain-containing protein [Pirellulaceae bacterium]
MKLSMGIIGWVTICLMGWLYVEAEQPMPDSVLKSDPWCVYQPPAEIDRGKKIVLLAGDEEYRSEEALPMLGQMLSQRHGFHCVVLFPINPSTGVIDPNCQTNVPGMHHLQDADLVIVAWRFRCLPDDQMTWFVDYLERGKPLIALRTSTHAFQYPDDSTSPFARFAYNDRTFVGGFGKQLLGETWVAHHGAHGRESTRGIPNTLTADHPILTGVTDVWGPTDVYTVGELPDDAEIIMYGQVLEGMQPDSPPVLGRKNEPMMPLVWTRVYPGLSHQPNRIVCTTMGAATDFESAGLRRTILNSVLWLLDPQADISPELSVEPIGDYRPTEFGFHRFQVGRTPRDYDFPSPR